MLITSSTKLGDPRRYGEFRVARIDSLRRCCAVGQDLVGRRLRTYTTGLTAHAAGPPLPHDSRGASCSCASSYPSSVVGDLHELAVAVSG